MKRFKMGIAWIKYKDRIVNEVNNGKRGSCYSAIRKLGDGPCDLDKKQEFSKPLYCLAVLEGRQSKTKPILSQHDVHRKLKSVKRPNSAVNGDVPKKLFNKYSFLWAGPVASISRKPSKVLNGKQPNGRWNGNVLETQGWSKMRTMVDQSFITSIKDYLDLLQVQDW